MHRRSGYCIGKTVVRFLVKCLELEQNSLCEMQCWIIWEWQDMAPAHRMKNAMNILLYYSSVECHYLLEHIYLLIAVSASNLITICTWLSTLMNIMLQRVGYSKCCWNIFFFYASNSHGHALVHRMTDGLHRVRLRHLCNCVVSNGPHWISKMCK